MSNTHSYTHTTGIKDGKRVGSGGWRDHGVMSVGGRVMVGLGGGTKWPIRTIFRKKVLQAKFVTKSHKDVIFFIKDLGISYKKGKDRGLPQTLIF